VDLEEVLIHCQCIQLRARNASETLSPKFYIEETFPTASLSKLTNVTLAKHPGGPTEDIQKCIIFDSESETQQ